MWTRSCTWAWSELHNTNDASSCHNWIYTQNPFHTVWRKFMDISFASLWWCSIHTGTQIITIAVGISQQYSNAGWTMPWQVWGPTHNGNMHLHKIATFKLSLMFQIITAWSPVCSWFNNLVFVLSIESLQNHRSPCHLRTGPVPLCSKSVWILHIVSCKLWHCRMQIQQT